MESTRDFSTDVEILNSVAICRRAGETIVEDNGDMKAKADIITVAYMIVSVYPVTEEHVEKDLSLTAHLLPRDQFLGFAGSRSPSQVTSFCQHDPAYFSILHARTKFGSSATSRPGDKDVE